MQRLLIFLKAILAGALVSVLMAGLQVAARRAGIHLWQGFMFGVALGLSVGVALYIYQWQTKAKK